MALPAARAGERGAVAAAIQAALAAPAAVGGFGKPVHPGRAVGPYNPLRTWLSLDVLAQPYHPLGNRLVYKAGCP
ncbi:MAG: hypothetical protein IPG72_07805 [Ardenticatenales bacterium]|nr:hypothetical protein [Ardenticatenales bacterium]